ncbi:MAG TPA: J domain-containing protein, partial [Candidatus Binatia bacterium]|nr:J domain-containing protein [Candidatus Binatia bacterium]
LLASLPILFFRDRYKNLAAIAFLIGAAMHKYALSNRCGYCKARTENDSRICNECQIRLDTEKAEARERERQERERRTGADKNSEREHAAGENGFDPYQVLRIPTGASKEEIKAAYFNLIKQYHPDKVSHLGQEFQKLADEKAQLINRAYQILMTS